MPFDLATAKPVATGFDLASAKPVDQAAMTQQQAPPPSIGDQFKRQLGLTGRHVANAVMAIPLAASDAGIGIRNLLTGSQYDSASKMWNEGLNNLGVPEPKGLLEKGVGIASEMIAGSRLPTPSIANPAPAAFTKIDPTKIATLKASQEAGYVVPPSTTNPTLANKVMESLGGKVATAQDAAAKNADISNALLKVEFGIHPDAPLTQGTFKALRDEVAPAYEAIKKAGTMTADDTYTKALDKIGEKYAGASKSFPGLGNNEISKIIESLKQNTFEADSAIDATKVLREQASKAYAQGDSSLGRAYKTASSALEDLVERNLSNAGEAGKSLLNNFRKARETIAKTFSAEKAFNPATGNVNATKLAAQLTKGAPLTGNLETIGRFGQAFPKAAQAITDSGSVRNTDVIMGAGTAGLSKEPAWMLYPFLRMGVRNALLSGPGQSLAVPSGPSNMTPAANSSIQAIADLLGQRTSQ